MTALLHDTSAVLNCSLPPTDNAEGYQPQDGSLYELAADDEWLQQRVPDPKPPEAEWETRDRLKGFQKGGTGRKLGSGLDVRLSLEDVATVLLCRDTLSVVLKDVSPTGFLMGAPERVQDVRNELGRCSENKMSGRVF